MVSFYFFEGPYKTKPHYRPFDENTRRRLKNLIQSWKELKDYDTRDLAILFRWQENEEVARWFWFGRFYSVGYYPSSTPAESVIRRLLRNNKCVIEIALLKGCPMEQVLYAFFHEFRHYIQYKTGKGWLKRRELERDAREWSYEMVRRLIGV